MKDQVIALSSAIADRIISLLEEGATDAEGWRRAMRRLEKRWGRDAYTVLLFVLTHLEFTAEKAHDHWERILRQWEGLDRTVEGPVDLRVAVLMYFLRSQKKLRNPAIVELKILRRTQDSAIVDELTRLYNFRHFHERLKAEARRAERDGSTLSLLMIDADDFKAFNDTRGHLAGNVALRRLASVLRRAVRDTDVVARYGGEEFAILLPNTPTRRGSAPSGGAPRRASASASGSRASPGTPRGPSSWSSGPTRRSTSQRASGRTA